MFSKKFISICVSISIIIGILFSFMKSDYVFNDIRNVYAGQPVNQLSSYNNFETIKKDYCEKFLMLSDSEKISEEIKNHFDIIISDMDCVLENEDITNFSGDVDKYRGVIINSENLSDFKLFDKLIEYVNKGGNLIFANRPLASDNFLKYKDVFGIKEYYGLTNAKNMEVLTNIIIKGIGLKRTEDVDNSALDVVLSDDSKVHVISEDQIPLLWERNIENGKVFFANGQLLSDKANRGVLAGLISLTGNDFIYPIINSKVLFVDDFPAPFSNMESKLIYDEYKMNDDNFVKNIWWPDVAKVFKKYNAKPTGFIIYNYENQITDVENFDGDGYSESLIFKGENLLKFGGELGIHGFNHQPLRLEEYENDDLGYKNWKSYDDMLKAQLELKKFVESVYPNYEIKSYVAPSNIISKEGINALKEAFPELTTVSALYIAAKGETATEQEFKKENGIYTFPRYSSGYEFDDNEKWSIYNGITINGVFSHFIHPDDVLDAGRSDGQTWREMNEQFNMLMEDVYNNFKWLEAKTVSEGTRALGNYISKESIFNYTDSGVNGYLNNSTKSDYFILRTNKKIASSKGCTVEEIDNNIYLIHSQDVEFSIDFEGKE